MEDINDSEKYAFQEDVVKKKVREIIEKHLLECEYDDEHVPGWIDAICAETCEELYSHHKPYKYIVTCTISQRTGSALHSARAAHFDTVNDNCVTICWPKRSVRDPPNRSIITIVTIFAVSFQNSSI